MQAGNSRSKADLPPFVLAALASGAEGSRRPRCRKPYGFATLDSTPVLRSCCALRTKPPKGVQPAPFSPFCRRYDGFAACRYAVWSAAESHPACQEPAPAGYFQKMLALPKAILHPGSGRRYVFPVTLCWTVTLRRTAILTVESHHQTASLSRVAFVCSSCTLERKERLIHLRSRVFPLAKSVFKPEESCIRG